jgi:ubiquinone/menaquinone biosynthesis C-methylase UbiE
VHPAVIAILSLIGVGLFLWLVVMRIIRKLHPVPIPWRWVRFIDNPLRRWVQNPVKVLEQMGIHEGMRVLELGPGSGLFTLEASRRAGSSGRLYCLDIQPQLIARLKRKIERDGLENVALMVGDAAALPFADNSLDLAFLVTVFGEIPNKDEALRELYRVLCLGGILSVSEILVDPDYSLPGTIISQAHKAGFEPVQQFGNFFLYLLNFRKR